MVRKKKSPPISPDDAAPLTRLLKPEEVAELLGVTVQFLAKWRTYGQGPKFVRVGGRIRYRPADIEKYIAEQTVQSTSAA